MTKRLKDGDLMITADAAKVLGVSTEMVTKLANQGRLDPIRTVGGYRLFWTADVRRLRDQRRKAPRAGTPEQGRRGFVRVLPP
jgi:DNA-binding transcriptional MerR regulator